MSFLSHIVRLHVNEKNEGVFLVWQCQRCNKVRDYCLIVSKGNFSLAGLELSKPATMLDLRCSGCRYELRVDPSEMALLSQAREATLLLKEGGLTTESYQAKIQKLPARFVKDLIAITQTWKCSKCGESNPMSFDSCWNCRSNESVELGDLDDEAKPFPGFPRGGNSWE